MKRLFASLPPSLPEGPYEIVDGIIAEKRMSLLSQMGWQRTALSSWVFRARDRKLGWFTTETMFDFVVKKNRRCPDLAFVSYDRWPRHRGFKTEDGWDVRS